MFGQRFDKAMRLPDKLKNREHILRFGNEEKQAEEPARSGSYVFCRDGTLIPIDDPDLLNIITRENTPDQL